MSEPISRYKKILANLGLFYAAAIWGSTFFIVKGALSDIDPVILVSYRFLGAGIILLVFLKATGRPVLHAWRRGLWLAVILWLLYIPQTIGLVYTTASNSGFITGLFVAFVPVFLRAVLKRNPTLMETIASVVALGGMWILTGGLSDINLGDSLTLLAAIMYALHILYTDKYVKEQLDPYVLACQQFLLVGLFSICTGLAFNLPFRVTSTGALWTVVFLALLPTLSAFVIQLLAQKIISPTRVSLIFSLEPMFAAVFAWTLGNEPFILHRGIGGLFIVAALMISGISMPQRAKNKAAA